MFVRVRVYKRDTLALLRRIKVTRGMWGAGEEVEREPETVLRRRLQKPGREAMRVFLKLAKNPLTMTFASDV